MTFHRIAEVRKREGVTLRTMGRKLGMTVADYRELEECGDLPLSELARIAVAIGVPIQELVASADEDEVQRLRALTVRTMKIAGELCQRLKQGTAGHRLAESLRSQIAAAMPESLGLGSLPAVGQRRSLNDLGRVAWHPVPDPEYHADLPVDYSQ